MAGRSGKERQAESWGPELPVVASKPQDSMPPTASSFPHQPKNWAILACRDLQAFGFKPNRKLSAFLDQF
jgi:hypothetical protein